jgi:cell division protein FtsB
VRAARSRPSGGPRAAAGRAAGDRAGGRLGTERSTGGSAAPGEKVRVGRVGSAGGASESIRLSRAHRMALATSGMLGVSSTRRAAILALVVCALALTVAVPLRNYLTQRQELSALQAKQHQLAGEVDELTRRRDQLSDPAQVQAEARDRLGYVRPGEVPYVVQLPGDAAAVAARAGGAAGAPWFDVLWSDVRGVQR